MTYPLLKKLDETKNISLKIEILQNVFLRDDALIIIKDNFNALTKRSYFKMIAKKLFYFLANDPASANEELLYLLTIKQISISLLPPRRMDEFLKHIPGFFELVLSRWREIDLNSEQIVTSLTRFALQDEKKLLKLAKKIFTSKNKEGVKHFISCIAYKNGLADYEVFTPFIHTSKIDSIPYLLSSYAYLDEHLSTFLIDHFEEFFCLEKDYKVSFLDNLKYDIPDSLKSKYDYLLKLLQSSPVPMETCRRLNILLANQSDSFIKEYIGSSKITFLNQGSTTQVFLIEDNKILKLCKKKHDSQTIYEHFLLAPTETKIIKDKYGKTKLYVERQAYLEKEYKGIPINETDFDHYFEELKKQHLILHDPHCIRRFTDNFGFLKDYHDAQLVGVSHHEELPDWFKERPMVLLDIDMIVKKESLKSYGLKR